MSVLERGALEDSPLADLHTIASELSIDGYRRLRKEQLIDAILAQQGDGDGPAPAAAEESAGEPADDSAQEADDATARPRRRRGRRGGRSKAAQAADDEQPEAKPATEAEEAVQTDEDEIVEGQVELVANGSGFLRVNPPETSDDDIYISAAQVKRCELISGDKISGPRRAPRRSERFASLYRIDTVNSRPASEIADGVRFDDLPAAFPNERFALDSDDETLKAIASLTPIGKGSRVSIVGPARSGKTETLRRLANALAGQDGLQVLIVLAGVRPEEIGEWQGELEPAQAVSLAASSDTQAQAVGTAIEQARRIAARGGDVVVLIDTLDGLQHHAARRALASARNIPDGGSLTVIATASEPFGGETTVIALSGAESESGPAPAIDPAASGTIRAELLAGK
jgi:transcription termination factor Rho